MAPTNSTALPTPAEVLEQRIQTLQDQLDLNTASPPTNKELLLTAIKHADELASLYLREVEKLYTKHTNCHVRMLQIRGDYNSAVRIAELLGLRARNFDESSETAKLAFALRGQIWCAMVRFEKCMGAMEDLEKGLEAVERS